MKIRGLHPCLQVLNRKLLGKSTLSDVFEWFFYDKIDHLIGEEIGRKGYEALRNTSLNDNETASLELEFSEGDCNGKKIIEYKNSKLNATHSNVSDAFKDYIDATHEERLILRYSDLVSFVLSGKTDKLRALSDIIGYSQITNTRDTFRTVLNRLSKEIRTKNFDNQISHQQSQIIEQYSQNVTTDEQFIEVVRELVRPFSLNIKIDELKDINEVLKRIKKTDDSKEIKQETFLVKIEENLVNLPVNLDELEAQYTNYKILFNSIVSDIKKLKKLIIEKLLTAGKDLLSSEDYTEDNCPLCLEKKGKVELLSDINIRMTELEEIKNDQKKLNESKAVFKQQIIETLQLLQPLYGDKQVNQDDNAGHKKNGSSPDQVGKHHRSTPCGKMALPLIEWVNIIEVHPVGRDQGLQDGSKWH